MSRRDFRMSRGRYASGATQFSPGQISGLMVWYRADLGVTLNSGNVSALADQSGVGDANRNLSQGTAANQPPWNASDTHFNGHSSIGPYNNVAQTLPAVGAWSVAPPGTGTLFAVFRTGGAGTEILTRDPSNNNFELYQNTTTNCHFFLGGAQDNGANVSNMNNTHVYGASFQAGGNCALSQDAITPSGTFAVTAGSAASLSVGTAGIFAGTWAELMVYSRQLAAAEFSAVMHYLGGRYAIAIGP